MATRNFWIEIEVDGRTTKVETGPQSADGGMRITLKQRNKGKITEALHIECTAKAGYLQTDARMDAEYWMPGDGMLTVATER